MADAHTKNHDYHIIDPKPLAADRCRRCLLMAIGGIAYMRRSVSGNGIDMLGLTLQVRGLAIWAS